jgi:uncharacterized protein (DUF58 family)
VRRSSASARVSARRGDFYTIDRSIMQLPSRYIWLTREGWYYILVLGFIIGGAILREVNLLVLLAGMMLGPLLFSWRWVATTIGRLSLQRRLPRTISVGDPLIIELEIANERRHLTSFAILATDQFEREAPPALDPPTQAEALAAAIAPDSTTRTSYLCLLTRRGRYRFGPIKLTTRFPLGLIAAAVRVECPAQLIVCPRVGRLAPRWEQWIDSERSGTQRTSPKRGLTEADYYGIREWRAGDSRRWIHWRTSARTNTLAVRQFEDQHTADVAIVLDLWLPSKPSDGAFGNVEVAVSVAATAVVDLCRRGNNTLTIGIHGKELDAWSAPATPAFAQDVLEKLAVVEAAPDDRLLAVIERVVESTLPGTRLIVFSTRSVDIERLLADLVARQAARQRSALTKTLWLDVTGPQLPQLFQLD